MKYLLLFLTCLFTSILYANNTERDEAYLQELAARYEEAAAQSDMDVELAAIELYLAEATRQKNDREERYIRLNKVSCYYNHDAYDLLYKEIDLQMDYFSLRGWWEEYYLAANIRVEALIFEDKPLSALREADRLYAEAQRSDNPMAVPMAVYNLFYCYHCFGRSEEAARIFEEVLTDRRNISDDLLAAFYKQYSDVLISLKRYDELLKHASVFEELIHRCDERALREGVVLDNSMYHFYIANTYADAYVGLGDYDKAEVYFKKMSELSHDRPSNRVSLLLLRAEILNGRGNYDEALSRIDSVLYDPSVSENSEVLLYHQSLKADFLHRSHRFAESSALYRQMIDLKDSIDNKDMEIQLNDLRTIYKLDQYQMEAALKKQQLLFLPCLQQAVWSEADRIS